MFNKWNSFCINGIWKIHFHDSSITCYWKCTLNYHKTFFTHLYYLTLLKMVRRIRNQLYKSHERHHTILILKWHPRKPLGSCHWLTTFSVIAKSMLKYNLTLFIEEIKPKHETAATITKRGWHILRIKCVFFEDWMLKNAQIIIISSYCF